MTVDMLSASFFWPELPPLVAPPEPAAVEPGACGAADDASALVGGFWAAVLRHLWHPPGPAVLP